MPPKKLTKKRALLLAELEYIVGGSCYNANIQNWGPNAIFEGEGRSFRYPLSTQNELGGVEKSYYKATAMDPEKLRTGYYAFGANRLYIVAALEQVLAYLENKYELKI